jgi:hypothetical protein
VISFSSNWPLAGRRRAGQTEHDVIERLQSPLIVTGACVDFATVYVDIIARYGEPRHSH